MINSAMLNELPDGELRSTIQQAEGILKKRDEDRKAKAIENARATLAAAGLTLKDLAAKKSRSKGKGPAYHNGHTYQHPANKTLVWNAKGQKPNWLRELEGQGGSALEIVATTKP